MHHYVFPNLLEAVYKRFEEITSEREYLKSASEFVNDSGLPLIDSSQMSDDEIHSKLASPYIKALSDMMKRRFDDNTTKMCLATSIFDPTNIPTSDTTYLSSQLSDLAPLHPTVSSYDVQDEWKTF